MVVMTVHAQHYLDQYLNGPYNLTLIGDSADRLLSPRDLAFKPNTDELWVVNKGDLNGGTNVIFYHAGLPGQVSEYRKDSHTSHFMLLPTALAFSDIGEFATTGESQSSNGGASTFMGPVLWSTDTDIFARVFQSNWVAGAPLGSHLDMLHQSPMAMGIAHDTIEAYWVFDGYNSDICKYDFVTNHGPGYENHDNGIIYRYTDVDVQREPDVPSHIVKDKSTGWLYIVDTGHKKLIRINTNTGVVVDTLVTPGTAQETLDGYYEMNGVVQEVIDSFTTRPCGIALYDGRLIVGDYDNGNITVYDITGSSPVMLGVIATGRQGMEGLEIGTDGKIWFVNNTDNAVYRIDPVPVVNDLAVEEITSPDIINAEKEFFSSGFNLCSTLVSPVVTIRNEGTNTQTFASLYYTIDGGSPVSYMWLGTLTSGQTASVSLPSSAVSSGKHKIVVYVSNPNDGNPANDRKEGSFRSESPVQELPFSESFSASVFPPPGWDYVHYNPNSFIAWDTVGGFGNSAGCFVMHNYPYLEDIAGQKDYVIMPPVDLGTASLNTNFEFNVAYVKYNLAKNDKLLIYASVDCGNTWDTIYFKSGSVLSTAGLSSAYFIPTSTQWRHETISLSAYSGNPEVLFMFVTLSAGGNNLYVDDVSVNDGGVSVEEISSPASLNVFPNPASGQAGVSFYAGKNEQAAIQLSDLQGRQVMEKLIAATEGINSTTIDVSGLAKGIYFLEMNIASGREKRKLVVN